jgi:hypothetical protein
MLAVDDPYSTLSRQRQDRVFPSLTLSETMISGAGSSSKLHQLRAADNEGQEESAVSDRGAAIAVMPTRDVIR